MEQVSTHCRKELLDRKKSVKDFDLYILREAVRDSKLALLAKRNIDRPIIVLHPHMKQTVLDCLGRKSLLLHVPGEEACSKNWVIKCVDLLFSLPNSPRRYLASQSLAPRSATPLAPSPASASPIYAPAPSDPAAASSPSPNPRPPVEPPEEPSSSPELIGLVPPAPPPPPKHFPPVDQLVPRNSSKNDNGVGDEKKKVVAIAATAAGVVVVVALLLFCCLKGSNKKIGPRDGKRDEKPLLELSMSDFSTGMYLSSLFH